MSDSTAAARDASLRRLFETAQQELRRRLRGLLGNMADAEDVAQEACLRVWDRRETIREMQPDGFLFRTATNLALSRLEQQRRRPTVEATEESLAPVADEITPERILVGRLELAAVVAAIETMPANHRRALELAREGMSTPQIGAELGCSAMSAWRYVAAAIRTLHEAREMARINNLPKA